ncbi:MAG: SH3 domain-containing protein [Thiotrichaceae bacterium]
MNKWTLLILPLFLLMTWLTACSNDEAEIDETITITDSTPIEDSSTPVSLEVILNTVNIRKSPSMDSLVVEKLQATSQVEWLNQVSKVIAPVKLRGVRYNDPWLYVKTSSDQTGWVYAATIKVVSNSQSAQALKHQLLTRRVETFFGNELATAINNYGQAYVQADTSDKFANVYTYGQNLRDQLVDVLKKKASATKKPAADMSWLNNILPGYSHNVIDNKYYFLSADYQQLAKKVQQTEGAEDDQFIALNSKIYTSGQETLVVNKNDKAILGELDTLMGSLPAFKDALFSLKSKFSR